MAEGVDLAKTVARNDAMGPDLSINPLSVNDYGTWKKLYADYAEVWSEPVVDDNLAQVWAFLTKPEYEAYGLGLRDKETLVGFMHYMLYPCTRSAKITCYLQDLYVAPQYRNKGHGKAMIQCLAEIGAKEGWRRIAWKTRPANQVAQKLYDSLAKHDDDVHYILSLDPLSSGQVFAKTGSPAK